MTTLNSLFNNLEAYNIRDEIIFYTDVHDLPYHQDPLVVDKYVMFLCREGRCKMTIGERNFELNKNEIIVCGPNDEVANVLLSVNCKCEIMCLSDRIIRDSITESHIWDKILHLLERPIISVQGSDMETLKLYGALLERKINEKMTNLNLEIIYSIIKSILYEILQRVEGSDASSPSQSLSGRVENIFRRFIELLIQSPIKPRRVSCYAEKLCMSPKYLSAVCRQVSGKSAYRWINEYVQKDINHLLKNSNKSIKEISEYLEFPNPSFFGKYVKAYSGLSPIIYREKLRSNNLTENQP